MNPASFYLRPLIVFYFAEVVPDEGSRSKWPTSRLWLSRTPITSEVSSSICLVIWMESDNCSKSSEETRSGVGSVHRSAQLFGTHGRLGRLHRGARDEQEGEYQTDGGAHAVRPAQRIWPVSSSIMCTCRKSAGAVRDLRTGEVSGEEDEDIQLCVSVPTGDVALEI